MNAAFKTFKFYLPCFAVRGAPFFAFHLPARFILPLLFSREYTHMIAFLPSAPLPYAINAMYR